MDEHVQSGGSVDRYVWYMSGVMAATNGDVWCPVPDYDANATIAKVYKSMSDSHAIYDYPAIHAILVGLEGLFPCE
ncbi:Rap1a/Tai family immunity protein [Kineobactrum sediminis]|nr:Rap1a/Tai family immunity protein [Kineobactrum sediminis]